MSELEPSQTTVPERIIHVGLRQSTKHWPRSALPLLAEPGVYSSQTPTTVTRENYYKPRFDDQGFIYLASVQPSLYWADMIHIDDRPVGKISLRNQRQRDIVQFSDYASLWFSKEQGVEPAMRAICHRMGDEKMYAHPDNPEFDLLQRERGMNRAVVKRVIREFSWWESWPDLDDETLSSGSRHFTALESQDYLEIRLQEALGLAEVKNRTSRKLEPVRVRPYLNAISGLNLYYADSIKPLIQDGNLVEARNQVGRTRRRLEQIIDINADWRTADPNEKRRKMLERRVTRARGIPYHSLAA